MLVGDASYVWLMAAKGITSYKKVWAATVADLTAYFKRDVIDSLEQVRLNNFTSNIEDPEGLI